MVARVARSLICAAIAAGTMPSPPLIAQSSGVINGVIRTTAARPRPLRVTTDQRVCGSELPDQSIVVDESGQLANAVVTVTGVKAPAAAGTEPVIVNSKCGFVPRVQVARPGAAVKVRSEDAILHNTNLQAPTGASIFNVGLPMPGPTVTRPLAAIGVVRVACNVHQWMRGWIVATDELAAVSGPDGRFTLTGLAPGQYTLKVWHEALAETTATVTVVAGTPAAVSVELRATP